VEQLLSAYRLRDTVNFIHSHITKCIKPEKWSPNSLQSGPQSGSLFDVGSFATEVVCIVRRSETLTAEAC